MDGFNNPGQAQGDLAICESNISTLKETSSELATNKANIDKSWKGANASSFLLQYDSLISAVENLIADLSAYQKKLSNVVSLVIGADTTFTNTGSGSTGSNSSGKSSGNRTNYTN